jgi:hypothetical protein
VKVGAQVLNDQGDALVGAGCDRAHTFWVRLNEFDDRHFGIIAPTAHGSQDAGIAALAIAIAGSHLLEQGVDEAAIEHIAQSLPSGGQGSVFSEGDNFIGLRANRFGSGFGGGNPTVAQQFGG